MKFQLQSLVLLAVLQSSIVAAQSQPANASSAAGNRNQPGDVSALGGLQLRPPSGLVKTGQSLPLAVTYCFVPSADGELRPLGFDCGADDPLAPPIPGPIRWSVNGVEGGTADLGTLAANGNSAIYRAPANRPTKPTVAVSAELPTDGGGKMLLVSNVTIIGDLQTYFGGFTVTSPATQSDVFYSASGSVVLEQVGERSTDYVAIAGSMTIDYKVDGCAQYHGEHPIIGAELSLDTPDTGQHSFTLGMETIELSCNGAQLGAAVSLHPCLPGKGGSDRVSIAGSAACYDGTFTWQLTRR